MLVFVEFMVSGSTSTSTDLAFTSVSLNDGAIPITPDNGTFTVSELLSVSGYVHYYNASRPVPGVLLTLENNQPFNVTTNEQGAYTIGGAVSGNYTLTPPKSDDTDAITSYDASFILRASAGLLSLSANQQLAADVDRSGSVTAMDASYVLEKAAGLIDVPFPGCTDSSH